MLAIGRNRDLADAAPPVQPAQHLFNVSAPGGLCGLRILSKSEGNGKYSADEQRGADGKETA